MTDARSHHDDARRDETDRAAREAARRLVLEPARPIEAAIDGALESVREDVERRRRHGLDAAEPDRPSRELVRRHHEAMLQQALGLEGHRDRVRAMFEVAAALMELLETHLEAGETRLAGRAARGRVDPDLVLHLRLYGDTDVGAIAQALVDHGVEEPGFRTAETRFGRFDRLVFQDEGWPVQLTLLPVRLLAEAERNLHRDEPVATLDLVAVRERAGG